jgi:hypothetical protein
VWQISYTITTILIASFAEPKTSNSISALLFSLHLSFNITQAIDNVYVRVLKHSYPFKPTETHHLAPLCRSFAAAAGDQVLGYGLKKR